MSLYNTYKTWRHKRHVKKFGSKNAGYFNYFNQEWFEKHQEILIWLLNHWFLKYWSRWILRIHKACKFSEYIDEIKPHTYRIKVGGNTYRSDFRVHWKFSKRIYYAFCPMWWFAHFFDWLLLDRLEPIPSFGFSTLTAYPDAGTGSTTTDGNLDIYGNFASEVSFTTSCNSCQDSSSSASRVDSTTTYIGVDVNGGKSYDNGTSSYVYYCFDICRAYFGFDTSSLGSGSTVSDAVLTTVQDSYAIQMGSMRIHLVTSSFATANQLAASDWVNISGSSITNKLNSINGDWTSLASYVSKTSITKFGFRADTDINRSASQGPIYYGDIYPAIPPSDSTQFWCRSADYSGTSSDPKLVVTYTLPTAPTVTTQAVSSIADTTATGNGNVTSENGATVTERGICWNTSTGPTTANSKATSAGTTGAYTVSITGLTVHTLYYARAYAINSLGTSYGSEVTFTTIRVDDAYTKLLLHMDGANASTTFTDETGKTVTAVGNAQISTAQSKFGGASGLFDGNGDYLTVPDSDDWFFDTGDFTIDFWFYLTTFGSGQYVTFVSQGPDSNNFFQLQILENGATDNAYIAEVAGGSVLTTGGGSLGVNIAVNTWYHFAVARNGGNIRFFVNGINNLTVTGVTGSFANHTGNFVVGRNDYNTSQYVFGYIDEFRVSKGIARWTANFTPPTSAYDLAAGPTNLKTINGLAKASIKTINGVAIGSIKSINGLQ